LAYENLISTKLIDKIDVVYPGVWIFAGVQKIPIKIISA